MSEAAPIAGAEVDEFRMPFILHTSLWPRIAGWAVAPLLAAVPFLLFGDDSFRDLYPLMGGTAIGTGLIVLPWRRRLVIEPGCVRTKGPFNLTQRRYQIAGLGDLVLDGTILRRRSDRNKILKLSRIECSPRDLQTLRTSIPSA